MVVRAVRLKRRCEEHFHRVSGPFDFRRGSNHQERLYRHPPGYRSDIIVRHVGGTRFGIKLDSSGLLSSAVTRSRDIHWRSLSLPSLLLDTFGRPEEFRKIRPSDTLSDTTGFLYAIS